MSLNLIDQAAQRKRIEAILANPVDYANEIESLRQQLASRDAEVAELKLKVRQEEAKFSIANYGWDTCSARLVESQKQVTLLRDALKYSRHQCEGLRVWGGMSWSYHPFQAKRIFDACEKALATTEPEIIYFGKYISANACSFVSHRLMATMLKCVTM